VQRDRAERRRGAIGPNGVDQVGLDRDQRRAGRGAGFAQSLRALHRMQPGVVTDPIAGREILLDPPVRGRVHQVLDSEQRGIHLLARLQRVAPIDEQQRTLHQHDGDPGRAGKPVSQASRCSDAGTYSF
jgi:hypothetical protein